CAMSGSNTSHLLVVFRRAAAYRLQALFCDRHEPATENAPVAQPDQPCLLQRGPPSRRVDVVRVVPAADLATADTMPRQLGQELRVGGGELHRSARFSSWPRSYPSCQRFANDRAYVTPPYQVRASPYGHSSGP